VRFAVSTFDRTNSPPGINFSADVNVEIHGDNNSVSVHPDIYALAQKAHKHFDEIATQVQKRTLDNFTASNSSREGTVQLDRTNEGDFKVKGVTRRDPDSNTFEAGLYSFNRKKRSGWLEVYIEEEERARAFRFTIDDEEDEETFDSCVESLKVGKSKVTAYKEYEVNSLGEKNIKKFFLQSVAPEYDS
jgi:hypothetical protein